MKVYIIKAMVFPVVMYRCESWTIKKAMCVHPTLCDSMDHSLPSSSVHGILQARILEWVAMPSSRGSSWPRNQTHALMSPSLQGGSVPLAPPGKPLQKADHQKIDAVELWCWRRLLRVPWTARRSNQSILKKINPEYSLEGLMLKFQYFGQLMWKVNSLEKTLMLEKGKRRKR